MHTGECMLHVPHDDCGHSNLARCLAGVYNANNTLAMEATQQLGNYCIVAAYSQSIQIALYILAYTTKLNIICTST